MTTDADEMDPAGGTGLFGSAGGTPYATYARLRRESPVVRIGAGGMWAVTKYKDVLRVLRDYETFSSVVGARQLAGEDVQPSMLFSDPPIHTRLRDLVGKAFSPKIVEERRPIVQGYCDELLDKMLAEPEADIVAGLAYPLPVRVISMMLGVADGDLATFKRWSDIIIQNIGSVLTATESPELIETIQQFDTYFRGRLEEIRRHPADNLLSELVYVETEEGKLTEAELLMFCRLLLVAGNETTTGLIINTIRALSEHPEALTKVREDMDLLPSALEEVLRFYSPFQATVRRTTKDVELGGETIPANERILVMVGSANRDEEVFERADEFDVTRKPNRHVAFGMGIHACIGLHLARMEADVAFRTLLPKIRGVTLLDDAGMGVLPGGPNSLRVRFDLAS